MAQLRPDLQMQDASDIEITKRTYSLREKAKWDYISAMDNAIRKGRERGIQKGISLAN
jgi:hypothetical protein